jgi:glycosyltransferase involved in cell wall biosynthesis
MTKKINLCYDGRNLVQSNHTGIYFTALNLLKELLKRDVNVFLYLDDKDSYKSDHLDGIVFPNDHILSPADDFSDIDVFFSPVFKIPDFLSEYPNVIKYTVLYDAIPLLFPTYFRQSDWYIEVVSALNSLDYYFAISDSARNDFLKYCSEIDPQKIKTTLISTNLEYHPNTDQKQLQACQKKYNLPHDKKYIFSLCSLEPRKNLIRSVKTFLRFISKNKIDDLVFVLGGGAWAGFMDKFNAEIPELKKFKNKIFMTGYIDTADLEILYSNAEWFVYTSQYEGFGMPPLEAMACGCAVITSNNSSLPEVVGNAAQTLTWDSDEEHVKAYEKYYFDNDFRQSMAKKGLERSKQFSWKKTVDGMLETIEAIEAKKHNRPLVTVITPRDLSAPNGSFTQNVQSIKNQTYPHIEHLVTDASKEDLCDILARAQGRYVAILPESDYYCDTTAVATLVSKAEEQQAEAVCANTRNAQKPVEVKNFIFGETAAFATFLTRTDVLKELNLSWNDLFENPDTLVYRLLQNENTIIAVNRSIVELSSPVSKENKIETLFQEYGQHHYLSRWDCMNLIDNGFLACKVEDVVFLGSKLQNTAWMREYFSRYINARVERALSHQIVFEDLFDRPLRKQIKLFNFLPIYTVIQKNNPLKIKQKFWLFGLPLMKKIAKSNKSIYKLFFILPVFKIIQKPNMTKYKILGLPLWKKKTKNPSKTKYYFCGIPLLTSRKK